MNDTGFSTALLDYTRGGEGGVTLMYLQNNKEKMKYLHRYDIV